MCSKIWPSWSLQNFIYLPKIAFTHKICVLQYVTETPIKLFYLLIYFWLYQTAHEILVPQPGIELVPSVVGAPGLNNWTVRKSQIILKQHIL